MQNCYFFLGEEDEDANLRIDALLKASNVGKIERRYSFDEDDLNRTIEDLQSDSFFSSESFIVLNEVQDIPQKPINFVEKLLKAIRGDSSSWLVLRTHETNIKGSKVLTTFDSIVTKDKKQIFYTLFENQRPNFVMRVVQSYGFVISFGTARLLADYSYPDKISMRNSVKILINSLRTSDPKRKTITDNDVFNFLSFDDERDEIYVFSFIARKDLRSAYLLGTGIAHAKKSYSSPICNLIPSLLRYMNRAIAYLENIKNKSADPWTLNYLQSVGSGKTTVKYPFEKNILADFLKNYSLEKAQFGLRQLLKFELATRSNYSLESLDSIFALCLEKIIRN